MKEVGLVEPKTPEREKYNIRKPRMSCLFSSVLQCQQALLE